MPNSKAPSISGTASTSRASRIGGVQLTPSQSTASSISGGGAVIYTPSTASHATGTPVASVASSLPTTSTSLNAVFARLGIDDQRKSLRSLQNTVLREALGCTQKEVPSLIITSTSDELWAAFCHLNVENRKKSLEIVRKFALKKAFDEGNGEASTKTAPNAASIAPTEATTNTLASFFKKLSVEDQEKALTAVQKRETPKNNLRSGDSDGNLNPSGAEEAKKETLIDSKPDLAEWQELCRACGVEVEDIPGSITKCKDVCLKMSTHSHRHLLTIASDPQDQERRTLRSQ
jgi:hypothetical protein